MTSGCRQNGMVLLDLKAGLCTAGYLDRRSLTQVVIMMRSKVGEELPEAGKIESLTLGIEFLLRLRIRWANRTDA